MFQGRYEAHFRCLLDARHGRFLLGCSLITEKRLLFSSSLILLSSSAIFLESSVSFRLICSLYLSKLSMVFLPWSSAKLGKLSLRSFMSWFDVAWMLSKARIRSSIRANVSCRSLTDVSMASSFSSFDKIASSVALRFADISSVVKELLSPS